MTLFIPVGRLIICPLAHLISSLFWISNTKDDRDEWKHIFDAVFKSLLLREDVKVSVNIGCTLNMMMWMHDIMLMRSFCRILTAWSLIQIITLFYIIIRRFSLSCASLVCSCSVAHWRGDYLGGCCCFSVLLADCLKCCVMLMRV